MGKKKRNKDRPQRASKEQMKKPKKFPIMPIVVVLGAVLVIGAFVYQNNKSTGDAAGGITAANIETYRGGETKPTLEPARFVGRTAAAYKVARKYRDLLDYMYCYCYCARSIGHKSLLSCYVDNHAANCDICQEQAFYAAKLYDKGNDKAQVRVAMDKKFWKPLR